MASFALQDAASLNKPERISDNVGRASQRTRAVACLLLPLTDEVADALLDYLRRDRPMGPWRQVFLRVEAPVGPLLSSAAIYGAFTRWVRRAGVPLPTRGGPHCLRHSLAMRLVQQGVSLKSVGDILGHRSAESTGIYLRLDVGSLREVGLPLPANIERGPS